LTGVLQHKSKVVLNLFQLEMYHVQIMTFPASFSRSFLRQKKTQFQIISLKCFENNLLTNQSAINKSTFFENFFQNTSDGFGMKQSAV